MDLHTTAFFSFSVKQRFDGAVQPIRDFLIQHPNIVEVHELFGERSDYIVKIMCRSNTEVRDIGESITRLDNVSPEHCFTSPVARVLKAVPGASF